MIYDYWEAATQIRDFADIRDWLTQENANEVVSTYFILKKQREKPLKEIQADNRNSRLLLCTSIHNKHNIIYKSFVENK